MKSKIEKTKSTICELDMKWVKATSASVADLCLSPPSWHEWIKLLEINKNCNYSPIIFSKSFPVVLSRTIGWNNTAELYKVLFGLRIIIVVEVLKWDGQWSRSIHVLAILISLLMYSLFLIIFLRYLHVNLSGPGVEKLLYLLMALISFAFEKEAQLITSLSGISFKKWVSIWQFWAELKELWSAFQRSSSLIQEQLLYWIALIAGSFLFLI